MDKKLQDLAWSVLPKEFKEEVKRIWSVEVDCATKYKSELHKHRIGLLYELFGEHLHWQNNPISDAEGEEMLTVPRSKVQEMWQRVYEQEAKYSKTEQNPTTREELYYNRGIMSVIDTLFGTKCLPDKVADEDNFASKEPKFKFKVGDVVRRTSDKTIHKIILIDDKPTTLPYQFENGTWSSEYYLEPYTGPEQN